VIGWLAVWTGTGAMVVFASLRGRRPTSGLAVAYVFAFGMIHWLPALVYSLPWYDPAHDPRIERVGFQQSTYAVLAFAAGNGLVAMAMRRKYIEVGDGSAVNSGITPGTGKIYLVVGAVAYVISSTGHAGLPSLQGLVALGQYLFLVGLCILCWNAWKSGRPGRMWLWFSVGLAMPVVTIAKQGFLFYGATAVLILFSFILGFLGSQRRVVLPTLVIAYVGLSAFLTYFRDRPQIRQTVWGGQTLAIRVTQLKTTASSFDWFNPKNQAELDRINGRLDQNYLVGSAVNRLTFSGQFAHGTTMVDALLGFIPRALWTSKPVRAGGSQIVTQFTGITFLGGTSVGPGPVMELYGNFGTGGVVAGFLVIGAALAFLDRTAARHLRTGHDALFVLSFLLGISLLQVADAFVNVALTMGETVAIFAAIKIVHSGRLARTVAGVDLSRSAEASGPRRARGLPEP
jgi:hypothetical protein